jgi:hypothetical protein
MIPSLILVRSEKKRLVTLTQKRNIQIGIREDSDVVVNHPHLHKHPQVLGPGSAPVKPAPEDPTSGELIETKPKTSFFLPIYTFSIDGLNVRMIRLKVLLSTLFIACIGILSLTAYLKNNSVFSSDQDWTPIILPAKGVYGFCRQDQSHGEGVRFSFKAKQSQPHLLMFFTGGKGDGTVITLSLNGTVINIPLSLPTGWGEERSVPLPSAYIREGENIVEIIPTSTTTGPASWGISDVRAQFTDQSNSPFGDAVVHEPALILEALSKVDMGGQELAHYYQSVSSWKTLTPSGSSPFNREDIMKEIEQKMRDKLHQVAFDIRSKNILGDESAVQQLIKDTSSWIPGNWLEGWEIYNELCR